MKGNNTIRLLAIWLAIVTVACIASDLLYNSEMKYREKVKDFNRRLVKAEKEGFELIRHIIESDKLSEEDIESLKEGSEEKGITVATYKDGTLSAWSGIGFDLPSEPTASLLCSRFQKVHNRWVVTDTVIKGDEIYLLLVDIYNSYTIRNDYIESGFNSYFGLPEKCTFSQDPTEGYMVTGLDGEYLFSVVFDRTSGFNTKFLLLAVLLWSAFLFLLLLLVNSLIYKYLEGWRGVTAAVFSALLIYLVFLFSGKPDLINKLDIFSPYRYTAGELIPSPGHLFLAALLFMYVSYTFNKLCYRCPKNESKYLRGIAALSIHLLIASSVYYLFNALLASLITDSNISFEFHKVLDIDYFTVITFFSAAILPAGLVIYLSRVFMMFSSAGRKLFVNSMIAPLIFLVIIYIAGGQNPLFPVLSFISFVYLIWLFRKGKTIIVINSISLSLVIGIYTAWFSSYRVADSEIDKLKLEAVKYSDSNDPMAELLLLEKWPALESDSLLKSMMTLDYFITNDVTNIYNYLDSAYFDAFWNQYDIIYTLCNYDSPLLLPEKEKEVNCFEFFESRMMDGTAIIDSSLCLLDNSSGRSYYLGKVLFKHEEAEKTGLFIEFIRRIENTLPGYPELLQNREYIDQYSWMKYSFAKYIGDSLVLQSGSYPFNLELKYNNTDVEAMVSVREENFECLVYRNSNDIAIVIARPVLKFQNVLINFTYIFIIYFILFTLSIVFLRPPESVGFSRVDFRQKLQYAFILVLLGSVIAIGTVVISLSTEQYRSKHFDNISEKLNSVYIELDHKLSGEDVLSAGWHQDAYPSLDALLVKFSNVFFTDINLYTTEGDLLATSRREVFDKDLKGTRMDFMAYSELKEFGEAQFIQEEKIGSLKYLSAYMPFNNYRNEVLAYLNLPYFAMQSKLSEEISNLVVTMVNFSLLLIVIAMGIAVFIAVRLTAPLRMLSEGLASVTLEGKSNKLEYRGHDEIGKLVNQYNEMLEQLHESALKLARSEREGAWRDMAKQIAHEIKNPLTPMKLNVQQLQKSWSHKHPEFDKHIKAFADNMIENIDNLSSIATEFSNFARMPQANPREINLLAQINSSAELFKNIRNVSINISCPDLKEVIIYADKEQIYSMLTNVIRNAVQSIPSNRTGVVDIGLKTEEDRVLISVSDNGVGIPDDMGDKMFIPNFTTKSSGMGIGLAIVKRIVETANGTITYRSEVDKGTTFIIDFPLISLARN
ncbi:MAG: HAMP domain-containing sensor histidine kinase [Marinilabiliaceae bacterium]|jgi:signal transduction histidine kinase|nr:HAMP domain-containing sensor histidine kinase [Marinilabiliaceae bacterium]